MGSLAIIGSAFAFYFSTFFVAQGQEKSFLPVTYYVFSRFALGCVLFELYLLFKKKLPPIKNRRGLYLRAFWNTFAVYFYLYAVAFSGVTKGNILNMTYPIFVALLAPFYTKEKVHFVEILGIFFSFLGSYFIISGGKWLDFFAKDFLGLLSGLTAAVAVLSLKDIRKSDSTEQIIKVQFRFGLAVSLLILLLTEKAMGFSPVGFFYLILSGFLGFLGQLLLTYGFRYVSSVQGSLLSSLRIFIAYAFGLLLGKESFNFISSFGAFLIFSGNIFVSKKPLPKE